MKRNNKKGFTITELVIVIAVIAILAAVLIPTFSGVIDKAKKSAADQEAAVALKNMLTADDDASLEGVWYFVHEDGYWYQYANGKLESKDYVEGGLLPHTVDDNDVIYSKDDVANWIDIPTGVTVEIKELADLPASVEVIHVDGAAN